MTIYVIQSKRGTMQVPGTDVPRVAREVAQRDNEIVCVRIGQRPVYYVGPAGRLSPRQELLYRIEQLRAALGECCRVATNLKEQDIVDALFAAEVQFEDLEEVTPK